MIEVYIFGLTPISKQSLGLSGGDTRFIQIFKRLSKKINIIGIGTAELKNKLVANKIKIYHFSTIKTSLTFTNPVNLSLYSLYIFAKFVFTKKHIKKDSYVYGTSDLFWEVLPCAYSVLFCKSKWTQCIFHTYPTPSQRKGSKLLNYTGYLLQKISHFLIKKYSTSVIVVNPNTKLELVSKGFDKTKIFLNYCGVKIPTLTLKIKKEIDCISIGRLSKSKGVDDMINIWSQVCKTKKDAKLYLVGGCNKEELQEYSKLISQKKLQTNIVISGFVSEQKKSKLLSASKVYISCSHEEGFGISILEGIAHGLPTILWDLPVYKTIFSDVPYYIKQWDNNMFTKKILNLLKNKVKTEPKKQNLLLAKYSWKSIAKNEFNIINQNHS